MRVLIVALVFVLSVRGSHFRALDWRSDEALWRAAVTTTPTLTRPTLNLAIALSRSGRWEETQVWTARAVALTQRNQTDPAWTCRHIEWLTAMAPEPPFWPSFCGAPW